MHSTDVALSMCLSVGHERNKNGLADYGNIWVWLWIPTGWPKEPHWGH